MISQMRENEIKQSQDYHETKRELEKLFVNITKLTSKVGWLPTRYETFQKNCIEFLQDWEEAKEIAEVFRDLKGSLEFQRLPLNFQSIIKMFAYLGLVESLGVKSMDLALLILIANEKELHTRRPYSKHVETLKELKDIWNLGYKLEFLKASKISIFKNKIVKKKVRDKVAHLNFRVQNGEIRSKDGHLIDIDQHISDFWYGIDTLEIVLKDIGFWKWLGERRDQVEH